MEFTANYKKEDFDTLKDLENTLTPFAVYFGEDGTDGKFSWEGYLSVRVNGGGVNEVVGMTISIAPATAITFA
jgi:hypothetical protein